MTDQMTDERALELLRALHTTGGSAMTTNDRCSIGAALDHIAARLSALQAQQPDEKLADTQRAIIEAAESRGYRRGIEEAQHPGAQAVVAEHFGLTSKEVDELLAACLKPEEIGANAEKQHARVGELLGWFVRFLRGHANPKWFREHTYELAYYIATQAGNRTIDVEAAKQAAFKEGLRQPYAIRKLILGVTEANAAAPAQPPPIPEPSDEDVEAAWVAFQANIPGNTMRALLSNDRARLRERLGQAPGGDGDA